MRLHSALGRLALLLPLAGCGSAEGPKSPPPEMTSPPPAITQPTPPAGVKPVGAPAKAPARPAAVAQRPSGAIPPGAQLVGGSDPNFHVVAREDRPELMAMVVSPDPGVNSSLLQIQSVSAAPPVASTITLPAGFTAVADAPVDPSGLPTRIRCAADGAVMALVPVGLAVQGADGTPTASPRHPIDVDAFYMDIHEVTVEKFLRFREATKGDKTPPAVPLNARFPLQPAVGVNWRDAMQYAKWTGRELPTESEWEKAARGLSGFLYPWGNGRPIWERPRIPGQIDDTGSFRTDESPFGIQDLAGNAREWCQDFFAEDAYRQAPAAGSAAARNWPGPRTDKAGRRVVKGNPNGWEVWARDGFPMSERSPTIGFRCVLRASSPKAARTTASDSPISPPTPAAAPPAAPPKTSAF